MSSRRCYGWTVHPDRSDFSPGRAHSRAHAVNRRVKTNNPDTCEPCARARGYINRAFFFFLRKRPTTEDNYIYACSSAVLHVRKHVFFLGFQMIYPNPLTPTACVSASRKKSVCLREGTKHSLRANCVTEKTTYFCSLLCAITRARSARPLSFFLSFF